MPWNSPLKAYNLMSFSVFKVMQPSPQSTLDHFHHPKKETLQALAITPQCPPSQHLVATPLCSVSVDLPTLGISHIEFYRCGLSNLASGPGAVPHACNPSTLEG